MSDRTVTQENALVVIGAGPGGYAAAFLAADKGRKTLLVDDAEQPGGVCLNCGCIPSKTLLHLAKLVAEAREAAEHGVGLQLTGIDLERLRAWKNEVIARNASGLRQLAKARKVDLRRSTARFTGRNALRLAGVDGTVTEALFADAVIATGSRPATIPGLSVDSPRIMESASALDIPEIPGTLLVIGGGYIGLEIGTVYAALGSRVTVVELTADLLPGADRDLVRILHNRLKKTFASILLKTRVESLTDTGEGVCATMVTEGAAAPSQQVYDRVLVAVGRVPNSNDLGLETAAIRVDEDGLIVVDGQQRTTNEHVFAIGDVVGGPMLAHKASHEARAVVDVLVGKALCAASSVVPAVVFTDPEVAWAGLSEAEAGRQGVPFEVARFPWAASGRAATLGRTDGLTKILVSPEDKRVLGVGIVGSGAGELLAEGVLAIETRATAHDLARCVHAHPTLSETIGEAAESALGSTPHIFRPPR